jgi:hypothetical protein
LKEIFVTIIFSILFTLNGNSQSISAKVASKFPQSVIINIYNDVASKMSLKDSLQFQLAKLYLKRDSLIYYALTKPLGKLNFKRYSDSLQYNIEIQFKKLLTTTEKREYFLKVERARVVNYPIFHDSIYMDLQMDSQFGLALALFDKFNLKPYQKDSLLLYATLLNKKELYAKENPDSGYFDKAYFESENMPKCLKDLEYNGLLSIKNKTVAEAYSKHTWYTLNKENLLGGVNIYSKDSVLAQLKLFYLTKATFWDKFSNKPQYRDAVINQIPPPPILQKAISIKNNTAAKLEKYSW